MSEWLFKSFVLIIFSVDEYFSCINWYFSCINCLINSRRCLIKEALTWLWTSCTFAFCDHHGFKKNWVALRRRNQAEICKFQGWRDDHEVADAKCPLTRYIWTLIMHGFLVYVLSVHTLEPLFLIHSICIFKKSCIYSLTLNLVEIQIAKFQNFLLGFMDVFVDSQTFSCSEMCHF